MEIDAYLLETLGAKSDPILHFYEWEGDCATYGYLTDPNDYLDEEGMRAMGLSLARRSTGGGIVFHTWDFAFSVLIPASCQFFSLNTLDNYAFVNEVVRVAVQKFLGSSLLVLTPVDFGAPGASCSRFCMAKPTKYDVVLEGRKIAGAAQRKCKQGFLHQGMIALQAPPEEYLDTILKQGTHVKEAILSHTFPLLQQGSTKFDMDNARRKLKELIQQNFYEYA
jgi:lipoate-protein ligase A